MERAVFEHEMNRAKTMAEAGDKSDYWGGYRRGLRRKFHGENFGTLEEHELWMAAISSDDPQRQDRGRGYRKGFNFKQRP